MDDTGQPGGGVPSNGLALLVGFDVGIREDIVTWGESEEALTDWSLAAV
jgi:hypothetical protein